MLADCITKTSANPDVLIKAIDHGVLLNVDTHPEFRSLLKRKAFLVTWCCQNLQDARDIVSFMGTDIRTTVQAYFANSPSFLTTYIHPFLVGSNRHALTDPDEHCLQDQDIHVELL